MAVKQLSLSKRVWQILIEILLGLVVMLVSAFALLHTLYKTRVINPLEVRMEISPIKLESLTRLSDLNAYLDSYNLDYVVFDEKGQVKSHFLEKAQLAIAKQAFLENAIMETNSESYHPYRVGRKWTVLIRFPLIPEFSNRNWRKAYDFNQVFSYSILALGFLITIIPFIRFVFQARKEFQILVTAPKKVVKPNNHLDFDNVQIKEIRESIEAIQDMKNHLETLIDYEKQEKKDMIFQVSSLSHDIKTPLTIIKGNIGLIEACDSPEELTECLSYINDGVQQIEEYLDIMVNYSKWIHQPDAKKEVSLDSLIGGISSQVQGYIGKNIQFEIQNDSEQDSLYCASPNIERAVVNILTNAFDYAHHQVRLNILDFEDKLIFQVYNDGPAMDSQGLENMGKLFYTQDQGRNPSNKHYGLGLYFAKLTATLHGGSLTCQNLENGVLFSLSIQA